MFNSHQSANPSKGSAMSQAISGMGTVCGLAAVLFLAPMIYGISKPWTLDFLSDAWGPGLAPMLTFLVGAVECVAIFVAAKLIVVSLTTWALMSLTRRFI